MISCSMGIKDSDSQPLNLGSQNHEGFSHSTPKFTSFKPSSAATLYNRSGTSSAASGPDHYRRRRRQHDTSPDERCDFGSSLDQLRPAKQRSQSPVEPESPVYQRFEIDTTGDPRNQEFESLDRSKLPHYVRFGAGYLLGLTLSSRIVLDRSSNDASKVLIQSDQHVEQHHSGSRTLRSLTYTDCRELQNETQSISSDLTGFDLDFTPFDNGLAERPAQNDLAQEFGPEANQANLWEDHSGLENKQQSQNGTHRPAHRSPLLRNATTQGHETSFSQRIRQDPHDVRAWLGLISCYPSAHALMALAERKSVADLRLSLYAQALPHAKEAHAKETLTSGLMSEARVAWSIAKQSSHWTKILREQPESLVLRVQNLDFAQTNHHTFDYDAVRQAYLECLKLMQTRRAGLASSSPEAVEIYELQVYVILRMTLFLREAGYVEYSIAAWQALLEFEFFRPGSFTDGRQSRSSEAFSSFKAFWDAEASRIGDPDAHGWSQFDETQVPNPPSEPEPARSACNLIEASSSRSNLATWSALEHAKARESHVLGQRQQTTDPFAVTLFPEVEPFLITAAAPTCRQLPIDAFLVFCGLPPNQDRSGSRIRSWQNDPFVFQPSSDQQRPSLFDIPSTRSFPLHPQTLWADPKDWFYVFSANEPIFAQHRSLCLDWILRVIDALIHIQAVGPGLAEYRLALETAVAPWSARKKAKALLKTYPTSLRLYNGLALVENCLVDFSRARNIILTALDMSRDLDQPVQQESILLWHSLLWLHLQKGMYGKALENISYYPHLPSDELRDQGTRSAFRAVQVYSNPQAMSAPADTAKSLTSTRDHLLSNGEDQLAATAADSLVLLTYMQNNLSLVAASEILESNMNACGADRTFKEQSCQLFSRLIHHHCTRSKQFRPMDVRSLLAKAVTGFPLNPIFIALFSWHEARSRIDDRLQAMRDVIFNSASMNDETGSVVRHSWAIDGDLKRSLTLGSNVNATRATFERAVESLGGKHCAALWKRYFSFEIDNGEVKRAKNIFYRSISACPWMKDLYLIAFDYLHDVPDAMTEAEITGIYHVMERKGIRLHNDLNLLNDTSNG